MNLKKINLFISAFIRNKKLFHSYALILLITLSCIRESPLNPEADIEEFIIEEQYLSSSTIIDQANSKILIYLKPDAYQNGVAPILKLSKGATSIPASGTKINFKNPVIFTVKSESGENVKIYEVEVVEIGTWTFNFEVWTKNPTNNYEYPLDNNVQLWSSGNPEAALAGVPSQSEAYPTRSTSNGLNGSRAAEMRTIPGTSLSEFLGIKIIPGSFFLGDFNSNQALINPLAATEFGQPYFELPDKFTGYYMCAPGPTFQDQNGNPISGVKDRFSLYAVLFNGPLRLNGSNINTSDQVIARAELPNNLTPSSLTRFEVPFTYISGKTAGNNLMVAIVASSSYQGDQYRGAIGSKLTVDSLRIIAK